MDRIGYETTQTVHYFQIDGSRSMTPAALLSALQEMAISHSDSLGFSVQYNLTHHCFWSVVNWHLKLYRMPKYNETITLQTWSDKFARFQANRSFFLFDENGAIGAIEDTGTAGTYYPIPIRSLFIGDKTLGGLEAPDSNAIQWSFLPNWSDDLAIVAPSFNPLTDLKVAP